MVSNLRQHLKRPRFAVPLSLFILLLILLSVLPMIIESQARQWIYTHGGEEFRVENIDFNPFTLNLKLEQVSIKHKGMETLKLPTLILQSAWLSLFDHTLLIEQLTIQGLNIDVENITDESAYAGGILLHLLTTTEKVEAETKAEAWYINVLTLVVTDSTLKYSDSNTTSSLQIERFELSELDSKTASQSANIALNGTLNGSAISIQGALNAFSQPLSFQGDVNLTKLDLSNYAALTKPMLSSLAGYLSLDSHLLINYQEPQPLSLVNRGDINLADVVLALNSNNIELALTALDWQGEFKLENAQPEVVATVQLEKLRLRSLNDQLALLEIKKIDLLDIKLKQNYELEINKLSIAELYLNPQQDEQPLLSNQLLSISNLSFSSTEGLHLAAIEQQGLKSLLHKQNVDAWGHTHFVDRIDEILASFNSTATVDSSESDNLKIVVGGYQLKDAQFSFTDQTTDPIFNTHLQIQNIDLATLDSSKPEQLVKLVVNATMDKKSNVVINADLQPFLAEPALNLKASISGLPMLSLSSYTGKLLGYDMVSGEMNIETDLVIKEQYVDARNTLKIHHLEVQELDKVRLEKINGNKIASLETGLSMLRDNNNTIELDIPLKGAIDDVQVNPSDIISQAIGSALATGAKTYLATALFPFGTLLVIADSMSDSAMKVELEPIVFDANSSSLSKEQQSYLEKISTILQQRPEMFVKICAKATNSDKQLLLSQLLAAQAEAATATNQAADENTKVAMPSLPDSRLINLAETRAKVVEDYLLQQQGIEDNRLISCQVMLELEQADSKPRVEMQF